MGLVTTRRRGCCMAAGLYRPGSIRIKYPHLVVLLHSPAAQTIARRILLGILLATDQKNFLKEWDYVRYLLRAPALPVLALLLPEYASDCRLATAVTRIECR